MKRIIFLCLMMNGFRCFAAAPMNVDQIDKKSRAEAIEAHKEMMRKKMNQNSQEQNIIFTQLAQSSDEEIKKDFELNFRKSLGIQNGKAMTSAQLTKMQSMWQVFMSSINQERTIAQANARNAGRVSNPQRIVFGITPQ